MKVIWAWLSPLLISPMMEVMILHLLTNVTFENTKIAVYTTTVKFLFFKINLDKLTFLHMRKKFTLSK